ncbi:MAG TPA: D-alanyl-D-alanine carboxypeptidase/D-alanyl-D-alanine-endopeptidase [Thiolinea sp.]|nr:D-alanyl-D-alanine carboxypeptidase/D-alanyl-D-alanine-endopeptidase [Thiolinea sp.]
MARQQAEEQRQQQLAEQQQAEAQRQQQLAQRQQQQAQQQQLAEQRRQAYQQQLAQRQQQQNQPPQLAPAIQLQYAGGQMYTGPGRFTRLPDGVASNLRLRGVSERGMSAYVRTASGKAPALLTANADTPRNPASTMKLVTTYAALGTLGPNFRWPTEIYTTGPIQGGMLQGDVVIKGYGDPDFKEADLRRMLQSLRARGVQRIAGNLVADTSFFNVPYQNPGAFDGNAKAAYNAQPEALLYQGRGSRYQFKGLGKKIARTAGLPSSARARADLDTNLFAAFWKIWGGELRGQIQGDFRLGTTPANAQKVFTSFSAPLREVIKEINKESVNVMARQVLLSLAAYRMGAPGTPAKGAAAVGQFLESRGLSFPELRVENGSGLSRVARISARHLGEMLVDAYNSPFRNDYMNSLAVLGVDGTLENRMKNSPVNGRGRFKTGTLRNVRGLAGYLQTASGETYVVSLLHNDPKARSAARSAHDNLVEWVYWGPRNNFASAD